MTESKLIGKVHSAVYHQCQQRGCAAPVDVLIDVGALPKQKYEDWRYGKVPYLEQVCSCNLKKLSFIMSQIRKYAVKSNLKPSFCYYKQWGTKKKGGQGKEDIERAYATHFVDVKQIEQLKQNKKASQDREESPKDKLSREREDL